MNRLSVVVPTLDAEGMLGACLAALDGVDEVLVVDGGSSDGTVDVAARHGARIVASPRGRGAQLGAGASAATNDWLLFLHADTLLSTGWRAVAAAHMSGSPARAGYFRLRLDDRAWQARLIERGVALRNAALGLPYGDQGLLIARSLYQEVGGFRPLALMEDVDLARRIGRHRLRLLAADALTSASRWRRDGWMRRSSRNLACLASYYLGASPEQVAKLYR